MKNIILYILILLPTFTFAQAYEIIEVNYTANVKEIKNINTKGVEFSPVWHDNQLLFTSSREFDLLSVGENNWKNSGFLNIYKSDFKGGLVSETSKYKDAKIFSDNIKSKTHTGPLCFSITGDTVFYSQTLSKQKKRKLKIYKPQIYMAIKKDNKWQNIQLLPFNNSDYSYAHPSFDSKTKTLFFTSDKKGGKGGKDIYASKLTKTWSEPVNVEHINSAEDEMFPFVSDNDIFIASNRVGGKGGLDIYWANLNSNAKITAFESVNTEFDDFGIFILPGHEKGFIASNKLGNDDIYFLEIKKSITVRNEISGKFEYRSLDGEKVEGLYVMLIDEDGFVMDSVKTDENGEFNFKNLKSEKNITLKAISEKKLDLFIYDKDGDIIAMMLPDDENRFNYRKLRNENVGTLSIIPESQMNLELNTGILSGQFLYEKEPGRYPEGLKVVLTDDDGNKKLEGITDDRGNFDFENLSLSENYILTILENNENLTLYIYDKLGNIVTKLKSNEEGKFVYRKLNGIYSSGLVPISEGLGDDFEIDSKTITGNFDYKNLEGNFEGGLTVYIYDENGILIATEKSNKKGEFRFRNLPISNNFLFKLEENGQVLNMNDFSLYIEDRYGKKIAQLQRGEEGYFNYKPLGYKNDNTLISFQKDTLEFVFDKPKIEIIKVYFNSNKKNVISKDLKLLKTIETQLKKNRELKIEISAYADSRSSDDYNLVLSGERAKWIVNYLVKKGISKSRCVVNAYGEGQLAVKCVDCTDEDHAKNRRAELRIY